VGRMDSPDARLIQMSVGVQPPSWVGVVPNFPLGMTHMVDTMQSMGNICPQGLGLRVCTGGY
jgi:hypothetical protein